MEDRIFQKEKFYSSRIRKFTKDSLGSLYRIPEQKWRK